jgi:hypothetical protein
LTESGIVARQLLIIARARPRDEGIMGMAASVIMPVTMITEWRRRERGAASAIHASTMITESRHHELRRGLIALCGGSITVPPGADRPLRGPIATRFQPHSQAARNLQCNFH